MLRTLSKRAAILIAMLTGATGCSDTNVMPSEPAPIQATATPAAEAAAHAQEAHFRALSQESPGFAGYWYEDETLVAASTHEFADARLIRALRRDFLQAGSSEPEIRHRAVAFSFSELEASRNAILETALALSGVSFVDLDEQANRVVVGVSDPSAILQLTNVILTNGLTRRHFSFVRSRVITANGIEAAIPDGCMAGDPWFTTHCFRPVVGGLSMEVVNQQYLPVGRCTVGFTYRQADGSYAFVTAAHCGNTGTVEHDFYLQPQLSTGSPVTDPSLIGQEFADAHGTSCQFFTRRCRHSDSLLGKFSIPAAEVGFGKLINTIDSTGVWNASGSLTIDRSQPTVEIESNVLQHVGGSIVHKVGATTGHTFGAITRTCADFNADQGYRFLCQTEAAVYVDRGDSGAPVFGWNASTQRARLYGILWGRDAGMQRAYVSPIANIADDYSAQVLVTY